MQSEVGGKEESETHHFVGKASDFDIPLINERMPLICSDRFGAGHLFHLTNFRLTSALLFYYNKWYVFKRSVISTNRDRCKYPQRANSDRCTERKLPRHRAHGRVIRRISHDRDRCAHTWKTYVTPIFSTLTSNELIVPVDVDRFSRITE